MSSASVCRAEVVSLPQQRGAALDLEDLQRSVPLVGRGLTQLLVGRAEAGEHVHERPAAGRLLRGHDAVGVVERGGQRQFDEHVLARLHGPHGGVRVQPGG
jgi:hypothetical protein